MCIFNCICAFCTSCNGKKQTHPPDEFLIPPTSTLFRLYSSRATIKCLHGHIETKPNYIECIDGVLSSVPQKQVARGAQRCVVCTLSRPRLVTPCHALAGWPCQIWLSHTLSRAVYKGTGRLEYGTLSRSMHHTPVKGRINLKILLQVRRKVLLSLQKE